MNDRSHKDTRTISTSYSLPLVKIYTKLNKFKIQNPHPHSKSFHSNKYNNKNDKKADSNREYSFTRQTVWTEVSIVHIGLDLVNVRRTQLLCWSNASSVVGSVEKVNDNNYYFKRWVWNLLESNKNIRKIYFFENKCFILALWKLGAKVVSPYTLYEFFVQILELKNFYLIRINFRADKFSRTRSLRVIPV